MRTLFLIVCSIFSIPLYSGAILVTGGAGFIGSHVNEMLYRNGYSTVVLDNLSHGDKRAVLHGTFIEGDFGDPALLNRIFTEYQIDAVMHFGAFIYVGESMEKPLLYYQNNIASTLQLLEAMQSHGVNVFVFSSSASIFAEGEGLISEDHPCHPINPYGRTKLMMEWILEDLSRQRTLRYCSMRYFNAAGGDSRGEIKNYKKQENNLIPAILHNLLDSDGTVTIFGTSYPTPDGTCIRDYIHVEDLARAHIAALKQLLAGCSSRSYNLGNGKGYSVKEVIAAVEQVTGKKLHVLDGPPRQGDRTSLIADYRKAREELHWEPLFSLEAIIDHAWLALH